MFYITLYITLCGPIMYGYSQMDGWLDGWMDGWMDGWITQSVLQYFLTYILQLDCFQNILYTHKH